MCLIIASTLNPLSRHAGIVIGELHVEVSRHSEMRSLGLAQLTATCGGVEVTLLAYAVSAVHVSEAGTRSEKEKPCSMQAT